jgi:hypothetical protein
VNLVDLVVHAKAIEDWKAMKKEHNKWVHSDMAAMGLMQKAAKIDQWLFFFF